LLGHFRHEIGHYYWELLVKQRCEAAFVRLFGDPYNPSYQDALNRYYGSATPPSDWQSQFVSAYATMHPWEDFAETFATYLDIVSLLDTAYHVNFSGPPPLHDLDAMVLQYQQLGISLNELNRSMGTMDVVPEIVSPGVKEKMRFIHELVQPPGIQPARG
jgi:hypothetical protein